MRFDDVARALVHALKYGDRLDLAPTMGRWMARAGSELLAEADALIPVPLHWRRLWARRFNQSALLAKAIAGESGVAIADLALKRVKATAQQVGLTQAERAQNVQGAFRVPAERKAGVAGKRVVLIDDCADLRRHLGRLRPGAAAGRRPERGLAGVRAGCRRGPRPHINSGNRLKPIHEAHVMPPVEIYTTPYCPYCLDAKALLKKKNIEFIEFDVSRDRDLRTKMVERSQGRTTVPQIFIGATHVGGCDDLYELEGQGKLDPLLNGQAPG